MTENTSRVEPQRLNTENRKARHDYHILETCEAREAMHRPEDKSIREGRDNLPDRYAK
jgi:SsrA-binding protein